MILLLKMIIASPLKGQFDDHFGALFADISTAKIEKSSIEIEGGAKISYKILAAHEMLFISFSCSLVFA